MEAGGTAARQAATRAQVGRTSGNSPRLAKQDKVTILTGDRKGETGTLLAVNADSVLVQTDNNFVILVCDLDQVAKV